MTGPRVTETLANERTFLAYARTALAFIGFGFVIARFALFTREVAAVVHVPETPAAISSVFGTVMALAGVGCAAYGAHRYIESARAIRAGEDASMPDQSAVAIAAIIGVIGLVVMWTLLTIH